MKEINRRQQGTDYKIRPLLRIPADGSAGDF